MATKKAASSKRATAKKTASSTTTIKAKPATTTSQTVVKTVKAEKTSKLPDNIVNIVFAEIVGTFVLTLVAIATLKDLSAIYVGLTLTLMFLVIGAVSGSHINPAVTFGLWAARKVKTVLVPFYWGAQFLGAMLAVIVTNLVANNSLQLNFSHFSNLNWPIVGVELVGTAVFLFGLVAVLSRTELSHGARAVGAGFSLMIGLVVSAFLMTALQATVDTSKITKIEEVPHTLRVKGATLNPAVALASTEASDSSLTGGRPADKEKQFSRISLEVIIGTLVGAALGGNLYLLIAGRRL